MLNTLVCNHSIYKGSLWAIYNARDSHDGLRTLTTYQN